MRMHGTTVQLLWLAQDRPVCRYMKHTLLLMPRPRWMSHAQYMTFELTAPLRCSSVLGFWSAELRFCCRLSMPSIPRLRCELRRLV